MKLFQRSLMTPILKQPMDTTCSASMTSPGYLKFLESHSSSGFCDTILLIFLLSFSISFVDLPNLYSLLNVSILPAQKISSVHSATMTSTVFQSSSPQALYSSEYLYLVPPLCISKSDGLKLDSLLLSFTPLISVNERHQQLGQSRIHAWFLPLFLISHI